MAKYHFFISYSSRDGAGLARKIADALKEKDYSVWFDRDMDLSSRSFAQQVADVISDCECFLPIITDSFSDSVWGKQELMYAIEKSKERAKSIIPLVYSDKTMSPSLRLLLGNYQWIMIPNPEDVSDAVEKIDRSVGVEFKTAMLYERLAEYRALRHPVKETETLCQLIGLYCDRWSTAAADRRKLCLEICRLLEQMSGYGGEYNAEGKAVGRKMLDTLQKVSKLLWKDDTGRDIFREDLFFSAFAVRQNYWDREIRSEAADLITGGDVLIGAIDPCPLDRYIQYQQPYVEAFENALVWQKAALDGFSPEEKRFVEETPRFIFAQGRENTPAPRSKVEEKKEPVSEDEEILRSVAKFMQEGNRLFDALQQRGIAGDFLKCLLTSYERLKNYCQVVGATEVAADCVDRILEIRSLIDKADGSSGDNEKAENGIKSLLGFTLNTGSNYDVFISFKSEDTDLAEKVFKLCQKHMKVPFWSKRSLPELSESEYEKAIYQALDRSTHFVVVLSDLGYMEADWIEEEMRVFHREKNEGRKPENSNFVFVVTDELYAKIIGNNKRDIPIEYRGYQIIKMSEYESTLPQYFN